LTNLGSRMFDWLVGLASRKHVPLVLQRPQSGFADDEGRVYITDVSHAAVMVFDEEAGKLLVWRSAGPRLRFRTPVGIAPGANGEVLVVDADLRMVIRLDGEGEPVGSFGQGELTRPVGVARDAARGRIFVADAQAHDVKVFSDAGELIGRIGARGEGA